MNKNKVLITGASSGIGFSLMEYLSDRYHIIAVARNIELLKGRENVTPYQFDLMHPCNVNEQMEQIIREQGYIPYLINNAGVMTKSDILDLDENQVKESFQVNSFSPLIIMQKLIPAMQKYNYGRIINVTSGAPLNCSESFGVYSASKAALNAFTITAAKENNNFNIKINLMSPGPCKTKMAPNGTMDPSVCHPTVDYLLSLNTDGPTGKFFWLGHKIPLFPNLEGINWLEGKANERYEKIL